MKTVAVVAIVSISALALFAWSQSKKVDSMASDLSLIRSSITRAEEKSKARPFNPPPVAPKGWALPEFADESARAGLQGEPPELHGTLVKLERDAWTEIRRLLDSGVEGVPSELLLDIVARDVAGCPGNYVAALNMIRGDIRNYKAASL